jgi:hypothetical protein
MGTEVQDGGVASAPEVLTEKAGLMASGTIELPGTIKRPEIRKGAGGGPAPFLDSGFPVEGRRGNSVPLGSVPLSKTAVTSVKQFVMIVFICINDRILLPTRAAGRILKDDAHPDPLGQDVSHDDCRSTITLFDRVAIYAQCKRWV